MNTISDDELGRIGMRHVVGDGASKLYDIDESLLYKKPKKERLEIESRSKFADDRSYVKPNIGAATGGSNCFSIHGSHT